MSNTAGTTTFLPRVIDGGVTQLKIRQLTETIARLEDYVESLIAAEGLADMDPWVDDEVDDLRLASY
jgi:hypothetical protein